MRQLPALIFAATLILIAPISASAELSLALYSGKLLTDNSDLRLRQGGTDLTFNDVRWDDRSFENPIFYGARISYWFESHPTFGMAVDFTHAKTILRGSDTVAVQGSRGGTPVNAREPISATVQQFGLSHGLNMLTFNGLYRWFPVGKRGDTPLGRLQLYTGAGAGFSIPHVEASIAGVETGRYQFAAGPVANGMLGVNYDLLKHLSGFLEYKLSYADVEADLTGGGTINAATVNHQLIFGLAVNFNL